jgi:hypothetical protein
MNEPILLSQFEYSIPSPVVATAGVKNHIVARQLPLMKVAVDFKNGSLKLEGDWQFMTASSNDSIVGWADNFRGRVQIETAICPSLPVNLNDTKNDNLVFPLEGTIKYGDCVGYCCGLLVMDNVRVFNGLVSDQWNISFSLYDLKFTDCEMRFKLPVFITGAKHAEN